MYIISYVYFGFKHICNKYRAIIITGSYAITYINKNRIKRQWQARRFVCLKERAKESASTHTLVPLVSRVSTRTIENLRDVRTGSRQKGRYTQVNTIAYHLNGSLLSPLSKQVSETHSFAIHSVVSSSHHRREEKNARAMKGPLHKYAISVPKYNRIAEQSYL